MKNKLILVCTALLMSLMFIIPVSAISYEYKECGYDVFVNGFKMNKQDTANLNGYTFIKLRPYTEVTKQYINWNENERKAVMKTTFNQIQNLSQCVCKVNYMNQNTKVSTGFFINNNQFLMAYNETEDIINIDFNGQTYSNLNVVKYDINKNIALVETNINNNDKYVSLNSDVIDNTETGISISNAQKIQKQISYGDIIKQMSNNSYQTNIQVFEQSLGGLIINTKGDVLGMINKKNIHECAEFTCSKDIVDFLK